MTATITAETNVVPNSQTFRDQSGILPDNNEENFSLSAHDPDDEATLSNIPPGIV
jgi:hypothetical protein